MIPNQEHLKLLKTGTKTWNRWRDLNPEIQPMLIGANFANKDLSYVNFKGADLRTADFREARLYNTDFTSAILLGADFSGAVIWQTIFVNNDLSTAKGLNTTRHLGPSSISLDSIYRSQGNIPESFLRGCGLPNDFIAYVISFGSKAIEFYSCFISYSSNDRVFAERLYVDLQNKGVRCWFAPEDMKIGDSIRDRIDQTIRVHDKLLLILSEKSITSKWVEAEVEAALDKEKQLGRMVLFPIRLDNKVMDINVGWPALIKRARNIGDFTNWKEHDLYQKSFQRLLRDLKADDSELDRA
jgi:hypothetical protein